MYLNEQQAKEYINTNSVEGPIPLRVFQISRKDYKNALKNAFPDTSTSPDRKSYWEFLQEFLKTIITDEYFKELFINSESRMYRCFGRNEPYKNDNGVYSYPLIGSKTNLIPYSTALDAWNYIHSVGYEMDPTGIIDEEDTAFERMVFSNEFFSSKGWALQEYFEPLLFSPNLTFVLIYKAGFYQTPEERYFVNSDDEESFSLFGGKHLSREEILNLPTLRDLLEAVVIFRLVD